ncbi:MAG: hypothetical protein IJ087_12165 [Eggerthellaceae bacterium]|nr:hypothetical protein [Eggerthellaceae bacterium]
MIEHDESEAGCEHEQQDQCPGADERDAQDQGVSADSIGTPGEAPENVICYLEDEDGNEIGFVVEEDGREIEKYYEGIDAEGYELVEDPPVPVHGAEPGAETEPEAELEPGSEVKKMIAAAAGRGGVKLRAGAQAMLKVAWNKVKPQVDKTRKAASQKAVQLKDKVVETDFSVTREDVQAAASKLNEIANKGAATVMEVKDAYDEIMDDYESEQGQGEADS